jgi:hypothetical protein
MACSEGARARRALWQVIAEAIPPGAVCETRSAATSNIGHSLGIRDAPWNIQV